MSYKEASKQTRNILLGFDFLNNQPRLFGARSEILCEELCKSDELKYVVIMNHLDRCFFIARTKRLKTYLGAIASFIKGTNNYCASLDLRRAHTEKNADFWNVEVVSAVRSSIDSVRTILAGWRELGSLKHISQLETNNVVIFKVTHPPSGWSRYSSHRADREPHPSYIALQALVGLRLKVRKDKFISEKEKEILIRTYTNILTDIEKNPDLLIVENIKRTNFIQQQERSTDMVREINAVAHSSWLAGDYVKKILQK